MWIRLAGEFRDARFAPNEYEIDEAKAYEIHRFAFECMRGKSILYYHVMRFLFTVSYLIPQGMKF